MRCVRVAAALAKRVLQQKLHVVVALGRNAINKF